MLIDRPQITESSTIINATVASGTADPSLPSVGELFYRTDLGVLRVYTGGAWVEAGSAGVSAHASDTGLHLSSAQNTLLDGLAATLTATELNHVDGVTSPIQTQLNTIVTANGNQDTAISNLQTSSGNTATALNTHAADAAVHLTTNQNTFLDALNLAAPSTAATGVGYTFALTSDAQTQLNTLSTNKYNKSGGTISGGVIMQSGLDMSNSIITGLATPVGANDAATKAYVDSISQGLSWKTTVTAATSTANGNITLSGTQTLDGVAVQVGNRVLVKNQTNQTQNGIYIVSAGAWSRTIDSDTAAELDGAAVFVQGGLAHATTAWVQTNSAANIGSFTGSVIWSQFAAAGGATSGSGILISGSVISVRAGSGLSFGSPTANDLNISATSAFTFTGGQLDLSVTGVTAATYGNSTAVPAITVNAQGRVTVASNAISITSTNVGSTVVSRDGSGNFSAGTITATLSGNATSATNASQLGGVLASGYALLTGATFTGDITTFRSGSPTTGVIYLGNNAGSRYLYYDGTQYILNGANLSVNGSFVITTANVNSYAPTLGGVGASGSWSINSASSTLATKASTLAQNGGNGAAMTFNWSGLGGQPTWLWGGNDGVNHYVYNPSNFSVDNAAKVGGFTPSQTAGTGSRVVVADGSGYINNTYFNSTDNAQGSGVTSVMVKAGDNYLRSGTAGAVAAFISGQSMNIAGNASTSTSTTNLINGPIYSTSTGLGFGTAVQVREANLAGTQGSNAIAAPRLAFHWSGVVASSIVIETSGRMAIMNNPGTGYEALSSNGIAMNGATSVTGAISFTNNTFIRNNTGTYGAVELGGTQNSYSGVYLSNPGVTIGMYDNSGNGGTYDTTSGWQLYWNRADGCLGIGGSTTAAGYRAYTNGAHYVAGALATTGNITTNGSITAQGNVTAFSDKRLKTDIEPIHNALDKVSSMNGVSYRRIDTGDYQVGFLAQDLQKIVPEVVKENDDGMLSVAYGNMVAVLVEAIKELKAEVATLKADLNTFRGE